MKRKKTKKTNTGIKTSLSKEHISIDEYPLYQSRLIEIDIKVDSDKPTLDDCLSEFDSDFYLSEYPDVRQSILKGKLKSALDHFRNFGYKEGRKHKK